MSKHWSLADVPNLTGKRAVVTGVTSGIGEHTVTELARAGADVILVARNPKKLQTTVKEVILRAPRAKVDGVVGDLADLESVHSAAKEIESFGPISILVNNAGVMGTPHQRTKDGFELQFGTNHLGHFALTGLLLESLVDSGDARVVTLSSIMARAALKPPLGDPRVEGRYERWSIYSQSKLANLMFAFELDRRATKAGLPLTSVAAHPGYAHTALQKEVAIVDAFSGLIGQSAAMGALPSLMAATAPGLRGSTYIGPSGAFGTRGAPRIVKPPGPALNEENARALWELSEDATGVRFLS
ncbi:MAG TPA: oxidoreductase [Nocardioidaceae bacterium]|nr:oxidoreductase [Nocardioidaceae bacterium]